MNKKIIAAAFAALAFTLVGAAQQKGSISLSGKLGLDVGASTSKVKIGDNTTKSDVGYNPAFNLDAEIGFFPVDNFKIGLGLGYSYAGSQTAKSDDKWLMSRTNLFVLNPNFAYYLKIVDRFYYTPEIGVDLGFGGYRTDITTSNNIHQGAFAYNVYLLPANFEFKINKHWSLGMGFGSLGYAGTVIKADQDPDSTINVNAKVTSGTFQFALKGNAKVCFYF